MAARQGARRRAPEAAGVGSRSQARETGHEKKFNMEDAKSSRLARRRRRRRAVGLDVRGVCRVVTAKFGLGFPLRALLEGVDVRVREAAPGLPRLAVVTVSPIRSKWVQSMSRHSTSRSWRSPGKSPHSRCDIPKNWHLDSRRRWARRHFLGGSSPAQSGSSRSAAATG